jgi:2-oxo-3-hexenedioate decarboxylase
MDERIAAGMARMLSTRDTLLYDGARRLGWKAGFGTAAGMQALGIDAPLVGFMTSATLVADGATIDLDGWGNPLLESEIAVRMGADVPGDATRADAAAAVDALAPAIELTDVDVALVKRGVEDVLAHGIFHRAVVLGSWDTSRAGVRLDGIALDVVGSAADVVAADPQAVIGDIGEIVRHTAAVLADAGDGVRAGDVVITGAAVTPAPLSAGQHVRVSFTALGALELRFVA